jgi:hypothetical protein
LDLLLVLASLVGEMDCSSGLFFTNGRCSITMVSGSMSCIFNGPKLMERPQMVCCVKKSKPNDFLFAPLGKPATSFNDASRDFAGITLWLTTSYRYFLFIWIIQSSPCMPRPGSAFLDKIDHWVKDQEIC